MELPVILKCDIPSVLPWEEDEERINKKYVSKYRIQIKVSKSYFSSEVKWSRFSNILLTQVTYRSI